VTVAETEPRSLENSIGAHLLNERVAAGDALAFGTLYDAFVADTYSICLSKCTNPLSADKAMAKTWIFIWSHAATLSEQAGSTKFIVLSAAWTVTSQRGRYVPT
jgi:DNA-directed RNA polymerase specialized sigma24 family protein